MEHENALESAKETLGNAEVNQRKISVGIEQGAGKKEDKALVEMHKSMMSHEKEWIRKK